MKDQRIQRWEILWTFTNAQNVYHYVKEQTKFIDKFIYSGSIIPLLAYHYNSINRRKIQKVEDADKKNRNRRKHKVECYKNRSLNMGEIVQNNELICNVNNELICNVNNELIYNVNKLEKTLAKTSKNMKIYHR